MTKHAEPRSCVGLKKAFTILAVVFMIAILAVAVDHLGHVAKVGRTSAPAAAGGEAVSSTPQDPLAAYAPQLEYALSLLVVALVPAVMAFWAGRRHREAK